MLKKGDIILIIIVLFTVGVGFFTIKLYNGNDKKYDKIAVIKQYDKVIDKINLNNVNEPYQMEIGGKYKEIIQVENGRIRFIEADCPDQVCVNTGWISNRGETSVCLPNQALIIIEGENSKLDGVTY